MIYNPELMRLARWRLETSKQAAAKAAFQPPEGAGGQPGAAPAPDPSGGAGMPPAQPGAGGGMTAGMDPGAVAAAGTMGTGGGDLQSMVTQAVQQAVGGAGGAAGAAGKPAKADINTVATDVFQLKKLVLHSFRTICQALQIPFELPPDLLDGPNRDPRTGTPMLPGAPGSTSDPNRASPTSADLAGAGGSGDSGQTSAIPPISPMQGAFPGQPGGAPGAGEKSSAQVIGSEYGDPGASVFTRAAALASIVRRVTRAA